MVLPDPGARTTSSTMLPDPDDPWIGKGWGEDMYWGLIEVIEHGDDPVALREALHRRRAREALDVTSR